MERAFLVNWVLAALLLGVVRPSRSDPIAPFPPHLVGKASAVYALLERILPGSSPHFELKISNACPGIPRGKACFTLADGPARDGPVRDGPSNDKHDDEEEKGDDNRNNNSNNNNNNNNNNAVVAVTGTTASEIAAGVGYYLREYCSMTIGWGNESSMPKLPLGDLHVG